MALEFRSVTKEFTTGTGQNLVAVNDISFRVNEGEFVSVVGPSGCGKSTILSMTAGLYQPTRGEVYVSEEPVAGPNAHVGFMLQKDLLLPWRDIVSNIEFGLEARGVAKERASDREGAIADLSAVHADAAAPAGLRRRVAEVLTALGAAPETAQ